MSNINQFISGARPPKSIINSFASNGFTAIPLYTNTGITKFILSGSLTANTLKTVLSLSGQGVINYLAFMTQDSTTRTIRCKVTIDGNVVFDSTSTTTSGAYNGGHIIGSSANNTSGIPMITMDQIPYYSSVLVEVASSDTGTDKLAISTIYRVN